MSAITTGEGEEGCVIVEQTASTGSAKYIVVENGILDNGYRMNFATGIAEFWWLTGDFRSPQGSSAVISRCAELQRRYSGC